MESNGSSHASWADQWDYSSPDPIPETSNKTSAAAKYGKKVGEGLGKTKAVASNGVRKVKEGTTQGLHWIKDKYHSATRKH